jgi:murein tripeptide amidase MpaA
MLPFRRFVALAVFALPLAAITTAQAQQTVPERTHGVRTSTYAEVMAFIDSLQHRGAKMTVGTLGESPQGKRLPYVILARPMVATPAQAHATGKPILYVEANIHAGEVEGKEAVQMLMRDLTLGSLKPLLDSVIVLFVPIYNADGNDAFGPQDLNRGEQDGPELVGLRANGQGYDLNRDYVKQEAPETRASLAFVSKWNPDLFMDLHTTDGSYHGYALTWSPGLSPNRTPTNDWVQDTVLEQVRNRVRSRFHFETYPYGNFRGGNATPTGWDTYESFPRYGTNLAGMTRVSILSEAYSHDPLPRRIDATYAFVLESIRYLNEHRGEMRRHELLTAAARPDSVVVRSATLTSSRVRMDTLLVAVTKTVTLPRSDSATRANAPRVPQHKDTVGVCAAAGANGAGRGGRGAGGAGGAGGRGAGARGGATSTTRDVQEGTGELHPVFMEVHDRFDAARKEAIPAAYVMGPEWSSVVDLMRRQGIAVQRTSARSMAMTTRFQVDSVVHARYFEGHCALITEGHWAAAPTADTVAAGSFLVSTNQRFGMLASFLLEPASEDGYAYWNFFDKALAAGQPSPVRKFLKTPALRGVPVP